MGWCGQEHYDACIAFGRLTDLWDFSMSTIAAHGSCMYAKRIALSILSNRAARGSLT